MKKLNILFVLLVMTFALPVTCAADAPSYLSRTHTYYSKGNVPKFVKISPNSDGETFSVSMGVGAGYNATTVDFFGSSFKVVEVSGSTIILYDRNQGNKVVISTYSGSVRLSTSDQMTHYSAGDYLRTTFYE